MIRFYTLSQLLSPTDWQLSLVHSAPQHRLIWITQGQGRALLGPRLQGLGAHNFMFVPANQLFLMEPSANLQGQMVLCTPGETSEFPAGPKLLRIRDLAVQTEVSNHFDALVREQHEDRAYTDEAMRAHLSLLSVWLRRELDSTEINEPRSSASDRLIATFLDVLERSYQQGASMANYAEKLDVTPTHLSRVCKTQLGKSAAGLITNRTLHAARLALETTTTPAKDIATDLGFGSAAYFSRFILTHSGQSPRALRVAARERALSVH